jgi:hypothetical protein
VALIRNTGCNYLEPKDVTIPPATKRTTSTFATTSSTTLSTTSAGAGVEEPSAHAYINFQHIKDSRNARNKLNGQIFGGRTMEIEYSLGKPSRVVWVGGIGNSITPADIEAKLRVFGRLDKVDLKRRKVTGDAFAFVEFENVQDAVKAVKTLKGSALIRGINVRVGFSSSSKDQQPAPGEQQQGHEANRRGGGDRGDRGGDRGRAAVGRSRSRSRDRR